MKNIAICDDCEDYLNVIQNMLDACISEKGISYNIDRYTSGSELIEKVGDIEYDLIILDINMPGISGLDVAERIYDKTHGDNLVFISSEEGLVFKTLSFRPLFFVRKSNIEDDLKNAVVKWYELYGDEEMLTFEGSEEDTGIPLSDIVFIEIQRHYLNVNTVDDVKKLRGKISDLNYLSERKDFIKSHMSYICNNKFVKEVKENKVILKNGTEVPLSRSRSKDCRDKFKRYLIDQVI